jgi:hypothetical protein
MTGTLRFLFAFGCVTLALGSWAASGCGGDDESQVALFAEECNTECGNGLSCINHICTTMCTETTEASVCRPLSSLPTTCSNGYCYLSCMSQFNCPNGLTCTMSLEPQGTCRVQ